MFSNKSQVDKHVSSIVSKIRDQKEKCSRGYQFAKLYYDVKDYASASRWLESFSRVKEHHAPAYELRGKILEAQGEISGALAAYKHAYDLDKTLSSALIKICHLSLELEGGSEGARFWVEKMEQLYPNHKMLYPLKKQIYQSSPKKNPDDLGNLLKKELMENPNNANLRVKYVSYLSEHTSQGREQAIRYCIESEKMVPHPSSPEWYRCLINILKPQEGIHDSLKSSMERIRLHALNSALRLCIPLGGASVIDCQNLLCRFDSAIRYATLFDSSFIEEMESWLHLQAVLITARMIDKRSTSITYEDPAMVYLAYMAYKNAGVSNCNASVMVPDGDQDVTSPLANHLFALARRRRSEAGHILLSLLNGRSINNIIQQFDAHRPEGKLTLRKLVSDLYGKSNDDAILNNSAILVAEVGQESILIDWDELFYVDLASINACLRDPHVAVWLLASRDRNSVTTSGMHPQPVWQPLSDVVMNLTMEVVDQCFPGLPITPTFGPSAQSDQQHSPETLSRIDVLVYLLYSAISITRSPSSSPDQFYFLSQYRSVELLPSPDQRQWWNALIECCSTLSTGSGSVGQRRLIMQRGIDVLRLRGRPETLPSIISIATVMLSILKLYRLQSGLMDGAGDAVSDWIDYFASHLLNRIASLRRAREPSYSKMSNQKRYTTDFFPLWQAEGDLQLEESEILEIECLALIARADVAESLDDWVNASELWKRVTETVNNAILQRVSDIFTEFKSPHHRLAKTYIRLFDSSKEGIDVKKAILTQARAVLMKAKDELATQDESDSELRQDMDLVESCIRELPIGSSANDAEAVIAGQTNTHASSESVTLRSSKCNGSINMTPMRTPQSNPHSSGAYATRASPERSSRLESQLCSLTSLLERFINQQPENSRQLIETNIRLSNRVIELDRHLSEMKAKFREQRRVNAQLTNKVQELQMALIQATARPYATAGWSQQWMMSPQAAHVMSHLQQQQQQTQQTQHQQVQHLPQAGIQHLSAPGKSPRQSSIIGGNVSGCHFGEEDAYCEEDFYIYDDDDEVEVEVMNNQGLTEAGMRLAEQQHFSNQEYSLPSPGFFNSSTSTTKATANMTNTPTQSQLASGPNTIVTPPSLADFQKSIGISKPSLIESLTPVTPPSVTSADTATAQSRPLNLMSRTNTLQQPSATIFQKPQASGSALSTALGMSQTVAAVGRESSKITPPQVQTQPSYKPESLFTLTSMNKSASETHNGSQHSAFLANPKPLTTPQQPWFSPVSRLPTTQDRLTSMSNTGTTNPSATSKENVTGSMSLGFASRSPGQTNPLRKDESSSNNIASPVKTGNVSGGPEDFEPDVHFAPAVESLPELVEAVTGEENETKLFEERARLFRFNKSTGEWKTRGTGDIRILADDSRGKYRVVMRRDQVKKLCANHYISSAMRIQPFTSAPHAVMWAAKDFADGGEGTDETLAVRFKNDDHVTRFQQVFCECQAKLARKSDQTTKEDQKNKSTVKQSPTGDHFSKKGNSDIKTTENTKNQQKPLSELFKKKEGQWTCDVCVVTNNADSTSCVACTTPKPGSAPSTASRQSTGSTSKVQFGNFNMDPKHTPTGDHFNKKDQSDQRPLSELFKKKEGQWTCDVCVVTNNADSTSCVACTTPKPGSAPSSTKLSTGNTAFSTVQFGNFNNPAARNIFTTNVSNSSKDNVAATTQSAGGSNVSPIRFGNMPLAGTQASTTTASRPFLFGSPQTSMPGAKNMPSSSASQSPAFLFGDKKPTSTTVTGAPSSLSSEQNPPGSFVFGKSPSAFSSGSLIKPNSNHTPSAIGQASISSPAHFTDGASGLNTNTKAMTPGTGFSASSSTTDIKKGPQPMTTPEKKDTGTDDEQNTLDEENDNLYFKPVLESLPDKVESSTGEEGEIPLFECRAKLFRWHKVDEKEKSPEDGWRERGIGMIRILYNPSSRKSRVVMRREQVLKVCCNHQLSPSMNLKPMSSTGPSKAWTWYALDFSENNESYELFAVRFKEESESIKFYDAFNKGKVSSENEPVSPADVNKPSTASRSDNQNDDVIFLHFEPEVSKEQIDRATKLQLPKTFYAYENEKNENEVDSEEEDRIFNAFHARLKMDMKSSSGDTSLQATPQPEVSQSTSKSLPAISKDKTSDGFPSSQAPVFNTTLSSTTPTNGGQSKSLVFGSGSALPSFKDFAAFKDTSGTTGNAVFGSSGGFKSLGSGNQDGPEKTNENNKFQWAGAGKPLFGNIGADTKDKSGNETGQTNAQDEEDDNDGPTFEPVIPLPELVQVRTGEEDEEVLFRHRCRLYIFTDKQWKERGVGDMKILRRDDGRCRMIMRREQVHKLCCNQLISESLPDLKSMSSSNNGLCWFAIDYTDSIEGSQGQFAIRFKHVKELEEFESCVNSCKKYIADTKASSPQRTQQSPSTTTRDDETEDKQASKDNEEEEVDDEEEVWFASNVKITVVDADGSTKKQAEGLLRLVYDDDVCGGRIRCTPLSKERSSENICNHVVTMELMYIENQEQCALQWTALDFSEDEPHRRTFIVAFDSSTNHEQFKEAFSKASKQAVESELSERHDCEEVEVPEQIG